MLGVNGEKKRGIEVGYRRWRLRRALESMLVDV